MSVTTPPPPALSKRACRSWVRAPARIAGSGNDLILEGVCGDAVQCGANLKNESIAEALFARFVVVLRALDIRLCERRDTNRAAQGAG